jgi:hypothetical protein
MKTKPNKLRGHKPKNRDRYRMIFDLPASVQMAIRLRAVKDNCTTGDVLERAIRHTFPQDIFEAAKHIGEPEE